MLFQVSKRGSDEFLYRSKPTGILSTTVLKLIGVSMFTLISSDKNELLISIANLIIKSVNSFCNFGYRFLKIDSSCSLLGNGLSQITHLSANALFNVCVPA